MTTLITLLFLMAPQGAIPKPANAPSLVVQLVDPTWASIPYASVTVTAALAKKSNIGQTDKDGYAKFWIADEQEYTIEGKTKGFKTKRLKHIYLFKSDGTHGTAYIQLQLKLAGPFATVY